MNRFIMETGRLPVFAFPIRVRFLDEAVPALIASCKTGTIEVDPFFRYAGTG